MKDWIDMGGRRVCVGVNEASRLRVQRSREKYGKSAVD